MAFWEFLLQKDGDRSWLPLESPTVEILEGRYRVVGRSSRINTSVEIRIAHADLTEAVPVRRTQKRSSCTNQDGLVVILPFTQLQPGDWELYCIGDLMADMMGEGWHYGVKLQVLPAVQDADWEDDPQDAAFAEAAAPESVAEASIAQPAAIAESADMPAVAEAAAAPQTEPLQPALPEIVQPEFLPPLKLLLEQEMHIVRRGEPLLLRGRITSETPDSEQLLFQVRVRLFAPQNVQILFEQVYPLNPAVLPIPFTCSVPLPHHYETYLMLGEVRLEVVADWTTNSVATLASQSFKVTTDLHELLESIANSFTDLPEMPPPLESISLPSEVSGFASSGLLPPVQFQPAQSVLPPQLRSAEPEAAPKEKRVELPTFAQALAQTPESPELPEPQTAESPAAQDTDAAAPPDASAPAPSPDAIASPAQVLGTPEIGVAQRGEGASQGAAAGTGKAEAASEGVSKPSVRLPQFGSTALPQPNQSLIGDTDPEIDWQHDDLLKSRKPASEPSLAPEDIAFRSLNLQQRFLSRLQSLAQDSQLSAALQSQQTPDTPAESDNPQPTISVFDRPQEPIGEDAQLAQDEFVIEEGWEDLAAVQQRLPSGGTAKQSSYKPWLSVPPAPQPNGFALDEDEPLPIPTLQLSSDNLISGGSSLVRVKLPDCPTRLAVKLWLIDRQSRLLLDGPHWLTDFTPDGFGQWMSRIELFLPQGYLEVQVEAISVEIMTQRESEKAVEARSIQPPFSQYSYDSIDV